MTLPPIQTGPTNRALLVEDEFLVALNTQDYLVEAGYEVVAIATTLPGALAYASTLDIEVAILDVNLEGERSFPVAHVLRERGIPFVFATGYGVEGIDEALAGTPTLAKPFRYEELERAIACARAAAPRHSACGGSTARPALVRAS